MLSPVVPASVRTSPGYLKSLHQQWGARQSPAVCRTCVGSLTFLLLCGQAILAADVLANHRSVQLLFESYSFLNKSNLVMRLKDEKLLHLTSGFRLQKVACIWMLTSDIYVG